MTTYVIPVGYPLKKLYEMELELDFLPCIEREQDRYMKFMKSYDPNWKPAFDEAFPRAIFTFDGGDEHIKALIEE